MDTDEKYKKCLGMMMLICIKPRQYWRLDSRKD